MLLERPLGISQSTTAFEMQRGLAVADRLPFAQAAGLHPKQWDCIAAMFSRPAAQVMGGGSGMGGKSGGLRAAAVYTHLRLAKEGFTGENTLFGAGSYEDLRDRHFKYFQEEWGEWGEVKYNHKIHGRCFLFNNPQLGAIEFRNFGDVGERRGAEAAAGFFDETTQILRDVFGGLAYRVRKPGLPWNPILTMTNPDGIGFQWVKALWRPHWLDRVLHEATPYEKDVDPLGVSDPRDYIFVGFLPTDNPAFTEEQFKRAVAHLPEHIARARRFGLWDSPEGARWPFLKPETHVFNMSERFPGGIPDGWTFLLAVDYGYRAPYCALWMAVDPEGDVWVYREDYKTGFTADIQASRIQELTLENERIDEAILDNQFWQQTQKIDSVQATKTLVEDYEAVLCTDDRFPSALTPGFKPMRVVSLAALDRYLNRDNGLPNIWFEERCRNAWSELTGAVFNSKNPLSEDIDDKSPDHAITAIYYALMTHFDVPRPPKLSGAISPADIAAARVRNHEKAVSRSIRNLGKDIRRSSRRVL